MKFNFKKVAAITTSVLMTGMTIGGAMAAGVSPSDATAVVYGANAAALDNTQAVAIGDFLKGQMKGSTTVEGGEAFTLDKDSNHFNLGDSINTIYPTLDDDELGNMLADGDYDDGDVDTEYDQKITLASKTLELFADADYADKEPTLGFHYAKNAEVLNYTMDFDDAINYSTMEGTDLPLMGNEYYVLTADETNQKLTLLDSASTTVITEGETVTIDGKVISVVLGDSWAKFTVDGETVDKMVDGESEELADESWIAVKEVLYQSKETAVSSVEFTIGAGKMVLENTKEVEINDDKVDGVYAFLDSGTLDEIVLQWTVDDESFLTEGASLTMPGFETIKVISGGMNFPDSETIGFETGETMTIEFPRFDLPIFTLNSTGTGIQYLGDETNTLVVDAAAASINLTEDDRFVLTILPDNNDLTDAETRYYQVNTIENDSTDLLVEFDDLIGTDDLSLDDLDATDDGDFTFDIESILDDAYVVVTFTSGTAGTVSLDKVVTEKGLVVTLPHNADAAASNTEINLSAQPTGHTFLFQEADNDENIASGAQFTATVAIDSTEEELYITDANTTELETLSDNVYVSYVVSDLATKINEDRESDPDQFDIEYYGEEVTADVSVASSGAMIVSEAGSIVFKDSESTSYADKNVVIVGGSCVNAAAAEALGVSAGTCGESFTAATGVGAGQFLIKKVDGDIIVAGYEADDTVKAAQHIINNGVVEGIYSTATEEVVTA